MRFTSQEWLRAMACVQDEERTRLNQFVFVDDAVLSLVQNAFLGDDRNTFFTLTEPLIGRTAADPQRSVAHGWSQE